MRKIIPLLFFLIPLLNYAQSYDDSVRQRQSYLFDHFIDGAVLLKSGEINKAPLNYYSFDQSILFEKEGKIFTLTGLAAIDTIYLGDKKFIPVNNIFYEVVNTIGKTGLYITYTNKMRPWVATSDHDGTSKKDNNQVSNTVSNVYISRPYKGDYSVEIVKHYWLKDYRSLYKANSEKDFLKVFRESASPDISNFIIANHIDFKKEPDLVKLVNFCNKQ